MGGIAGLWLRRAARPASTGPVVVPVSRALGLVALSTFFLPLDGLPFYRSGALVFAGGHVVLPLLRNAFVAPGWVSDNTFLASYGAAQAVPGPLFTFAAYLGAVRIFRGVRRRCW